MARLLHDGAAQLEAGRGGPHAFAAASMHFARGDDAPNFAKALVKAARQAPQAERELFAVRAVLQVCFCIRLVVCLPASSRCNKDADPHLHMPQ